MKPESKAKYIARWHKYKIMLISGFCSMVICLLLMWSFLSRHYAVAVLKNQFSALESFLQSIGYDYAYDDIRFYSFLPWQIMRAKNFRIYALDESDFWQWTAEELSIDVGLLNNRKVDIYWGEKHKVQRNSVAWNVNISKSDIKLSLKNKDSFDLSLLLNDVRIKNLAQIGRVDIKFQRQQTPDWSLNTDIKGIHLDDMTGWPLNKEVEHIYVKSSLSGLWNHDLPLSDAFYVWAERGGYLKIEKMIVNWKPLITVAHGDIRFNQKSEPTLSLNTASLGMIETLDQLNANGFISNKGAYVVRILLNNKAVQQNPNDQHKTVVTPLKVSKDAVFLENIKLK